MREGFSGERMIVLPPMTVETERNDALASSLYITDIGYFPQAANHFRERRQPIGEYVLIYCVKGQGWCRIDDETYTLQDNQYVILPAGRPHAYGADKHNPWTIYWLHFKGEHASVYSEGLQQPQFIIPTHNSRISERQSVFEEIFETLNRSTDLESLRYASSLLHYYLASMRYVKNFRQLSAADAYNDVVTSARHYMQEHLEQRLTLEQMARYTGYSVSHFSKIFLEQTGESPLACLNRMKTERACQLLQTTDMHINQICHKVGIDDPFYFSRLFKKLVGMSPRQFRQIPTFG